MKISKFLMMTCSIFLAAGCAHNQTENQRYVFDESIAPTHPYMAGAGSSDVGSATSSDAAQAVSEPGMGAESNDLVTQVRQAMAEDSALAALIPNLQITANSGTITLAGTVSNEEQRQSIESIAKRTSGVVSVENQVQVSSQSAAAIADQGGASGGTADAHANTMQDGEQAGTEQLTPTSRIPAAKEQLNIKGLTESDRALAQQIARELGENNALAPAMSEIRISVNNGTVTLQGALGDEQRKRDIEAAIQRVTGVSAVDNQIQVTSGGPSRIDQ